MILDNIFIAKEGDCEEQYRLVIGDFGLSSKSKTELNSTICGTHNYLVIYNIEEN